MTKFCQGDGKTWCLQRQGIFINLYHSRRRHIPDDSVLDGQGLQHHRFHDIHQHVLSSALPNPFWDRSIQPATPKAGSPMSLYFTQIYACICRVIVLNASFLPKCCKHFSFLSFVTHSPFSLCVVIHCYMM